MKFKYLITNYKIMFNFKSFIINCLLLKSLKDDLEKHLKDFQKSEKNGDREKYINMLN